MFCSPKQKKNNNNILFGLNTANENQRTKIDDELFFLHAIPKLRVVCTLNM